MDQARYRQAEPVFRQALAASKRAFGPGTPELARALTQLAACCRSLARFSEAGPLYQRALFIAEDACGRQSSEVATVYHELGALEHAAGNWTRGVPFARAAVRVRRRVLGARHPLVAGDLMALAALLEGLKKYEEAERLYSRAIGILEQSQAGHPDLAVAFNNLAAIQQARRRPARAEELYRRARALDTAHFGPGHPRVAFCANNLGVLLTTLRRPQEAAMLFRSALSIFRRAFGARSPNVGRCLENHAAALRALGRRREAAAASRRAAGILGGIESVSDNGVAATATINPEMARFRLIVQPSPISRLGVFAEEPIPAGRRVLEYAGERVGRREARRRSLLACSYLVEMDGYWLDGAIGGSGAEYVNHSCAPNLRVRRVRGRILYFSRRAIDKGEELTIDYAYSPDVELTPCHCGAPACRGTINRTRRPDPRGDRRRQGTQIKP
jgi:tetratricopeptide (TPR) repeat protein